MFPLTDPILVFAILSGIILISPVLYKRFGIPDLVLLLGFGVLLGPSGFHILERNTGIIMLGTVGKLYIMFLAGIEIDLYRFSRSYKRSILFGLFTFSIPQGIGTLAGHYLLGMNWAASVLLASLFASHTLLAYPITQRFGISRTEPVAITVGATIITDTLALLVLAVIADSARGMDLGPEFWIIILAGLAGLVIFISKAVPRISRWFFRTVPEKSNAQFLYVIVTVCICSYLSVFARMEPIIGAFLVGAAFNRLIPEQSPLMNRLHFAGNTLFIPFFLISVGMMVDPRAMIDNPLNWFVGGVMIGAVIVTKYLAAQCVRFIFRYTNAEANVMFGLSVIQAAATLAAVVVGYELEIFDKGVLNGAILMIIVTSPLGFAIVDRYGRRMLTAASLQTVSSIDEQRIMVSVSDPSEAEKLMELAVILRRDQIPGGIFPLSVALDRGNPEQTIAMSEKILGQCLAYAASADKKVKPELRMAVNVSDGIIQAARELRSSITIAGWAGERGGSIRLFGTILHHLGEDCSTRLLFARLKGPLNTTNRIIVPFLPMATRRRDLVLFIQDMKLLAHGIGSELVLYGSGDEADSLHRVVEKEKPDCRTSLVKSESWKELWASLLDDIRPLDLLAIPSCRRASEFWSPSIDNLAEQAAARYAELNFLIDYPSLPSMEELAGDTQDTSSHNSFPDLLPVETRGETSLKEALTLLAKKAFPGRPVAAARARRILLSTAKSYPIELAPGIVLLHARFESAYSPILSICHSSGGWQVGEIPVKPVILLVLFGPAGQTSETHLKTLSLIVARIKEAEKHVSLTSLPDAQEIARLLASPQNDLK